MGVDDPGQRDPALEERRASVRHRNEVAREMERIAREDKEELRRRAEESIAAKKDSSRDPP